MIFKCFVFSLVLLLATPFCNVRRMRFWNSLSAKILLGYSLVGGLLMLLVISALLQFRGLQAQLAEQWQVLRYHDAVRYARRMEKNYLLFHRKSDLKEALAKAREAAEAYAGMPVHLHRHPEIGAAVGQYLELLRELAEEPRRRPSQAVQDELYDIGSRLLTFGEDSDEQARKKLRDEISDHERNLMLTIGTAVFLVLVVGWGVTRSVIRPLREVEQRLRQVAGGASRLLESGEQDQEVRSLTVCINSALSELERRQELVSRSSRLVALGTMLSGVAHELNNPLSNISSSCQILQEELNELPPEAASRLLAQIDDQVLRAQGIVSSLLDFSRDRPLARQRLPLAELCDEALALVRVNLPAAVQVSSEVPGDLLIDVDRQRFLQVLVNLLKNAGEACAGEGRVVLGAVRDPLAGGVSLWVEDDGEGIAAADLPRIFDPFFTTKPVGSGTGLGLFVVHEILTRHGGTIAVDSSPGGPTRFRLFFPDASRMSRS